MEDSSNTHVVPPKRRTNPPSRQMHQYRANRDGPEGAEVDTWVMGGYLIDAVEDFAIRPESEPIVSGTKKTKNKKKQRSLKKKQNKFKKKKNLARKKKLISTF